MEPLLRIAPYKLRTLNGFRTYVGGTALSRKPVSFEMALHQAEALEKKGSAEEVKSYALSEDDIRRMIPTLRIKSYPEILQAQTLDDILDDKGRLILLYLTVDQSTGHWVCLLKRRGTKVVEFFDPYGKYGPDDEGEWNTKRKQKEFGQDTKHLSKLIRESPYKLVVNKTHFQKSQMDNNTCGRHCVTRLYLKHLSLPQYTKLIKRAEERGVSADDFVAGFTSYLIGK